MPLAIGRVTLLGILKSLFKERRSAGNDIGSGMLLAANGIKICAPSDPTNVPIIISDLLGNFKEPRPPTEGAEKAIPTVEGVQDCVSRFQEKPGKLLFLNCCQSDYWTNLSTLS